MLGNPFWGKGQVLVLPTSDHEDRGPVLSRCRVCDTQTSHSGILPQPTRQVTTSSEWGSEQEKSLQKSQTVVKLLLESHDLQIYRMVVDTTPGGASGQPQ